MTPVKSLFLSLLVLILIPATSLAANPIRLPRGNSSWSSYTNELALRILKVTEDPKHPDKIEWRAEYQAQKRQIRNVSEGIDFDLIWTMTSTDRESHANPVYVDIFKGLMGSRVFLIRRDMAEKFVNIKTPEDLKKISFVQGQDYPDTPILKSVGLTVHEGDSYGNMIEMLRHKRADAFPRGIPEPFIEKDLFHIAQDIVLEEHVMISYTAPCYFFFSKKDSSLRDRFKKGFEIIEKDGSFDRIFNKHFATVIKKINITNRVIFWIDNPYLSEQSKAALKQQKLWYGRTPLDPKKMVALPIVSTEHRPN